MEYKIEQDEDAFVVEPDTGKNLVIHDTIYVKDDRGEKYEILPKGTHIPVINKKIFISKKAVFSLDFFVGNY